MTITLSNKMSFFKPSIFSELAQYKQRKISEGAPIIDLSIGSPDLAPPSFITNSLSEEVLKADQYGYSLSGTNEFNRAVSSFYNRNYKVELDSIEEILLLMGSQDGLVHFPMVFANPGDVILVPDPGYTAYAAGIAMAGATPYFMPLKKEKNFLPDLSIIPSEVAEKAKLMILNFPGNPVPALADIEFFEKAVAFAKKFNILVLHDFAYSELYFEGKKPVSFLSIEGAKDIGVEMSSFSKNYNMAGTRIGFLAGNKDVVQAMNQLKSNLDYGVFLPIQKAAIRALEEGAHFCEESRKVYQERRDTLIEGLNELGWTITKPDAGMFIWAEVPKGFSSTEFTYELIDKAHVVVTPGHAFGPTGEGYVRIALVQDVEKLKKVITSIKNANIL
ncbi:MULTISPECIES: LL-diaminopimelate aminotransferase [Bacillaceae]|uniref:LL-diaminopimelate aminotransferase n=1 Tax=Bacillaceae TaxID=186817 RepID=UPI000BFDBAA5|nr:MULTISPECIES: LL-diaminopimelate aminotransferase [Bacillaceae]PGT80210.1 LL-diaminopimelate aminotransferase [Bacillus sp. AFS040349]UGB29039.1 LL-diaminopimelate aminotransferase [Metabacillus sp. B2-18]